jgi:orotidine-5'-phosphate decarboxylase
MEGESGDVDGMNLIKLKKSIIPSCDVATIAQLRKLVSSTCDVKGVSAYKIGFELVIPFGTEKICAEIRKITNLPIIYDHQKAATDIPETGEKFVSACRDVDAIILFPQAGPVTEREWIKAVQKSKKTVIVGGEMTHQGYLAETGGFLADDAPMQMYSIAAELGVKDYVVPGNKPNKILKYRKLLESKGIKPIFYSPGLVAQGGSITEGAKAAGEYWHAIVGRGIYGAKDMRKAAEELVSQLG